eukprot:gene6673-7428_t
MNSLLPTSDVKRFWLDRHVTVPGAFSPPSDTRLMNYYNYCYNQLHHQITFTAAQTFSSPFTQALLKRNIGNPQTESINNTDEPPEEHDESFWPSVQEQIHKMMLHQSLQRYNNDYELPLLELHDAYTEEREYSLVAPHVSLLEPIVPYDLSLIDVYEFSDSICFFQT